MAPLVDEPRAPVRAASLLALLAPSPVRVEFAARQALICALTTLCVTLYRTPEAALTVYMVFFLNRTDRASSVAMNLAVVVLMAVVIGLVLGVAMVVIDQPMLRVAAIAILSFVFLFLASASKLKPVGAIIALITGYALDQLGSTPAGELATRALLYAWLFAWIPAAVSVGVNLLIAPAPRRRAELALAGRLALAADMLSRADDRTRAKFEGVRLQGAADILAWLRLAGVEKTSATTDLAALHHAAESTTAILFLIGVAVDEPEAALPAAFRESLAETLRQMAAILKAGGYPLEIDLPWQEEANALSPLQAALVEDLREALARFAEAPRVLAPPPPAKAKRGFFLPDAFTNPEHVHYALKTTAAAMICYGLYTLLDWPGIHTCFITCFIVSLSTAGETVEKLTLRIVGCLVGAVIGLAAIVYVVPSLVSVGALMAVVFIGAFLAAWIAAGGPRIGYAGFQVAFAFFICVIQGAAPAFDLVEIRDRVIGILIGNLVAYLVFVNLWPVSVARAIDPAIQALLRGLSALGLTATMAGRHGKAVEALVVRRGIERNLELLHYEPRRLRPSAAWLQARTRAVEAATALVGPLLLAADRKPDVAQAAADRLGRVADALSDAPTFSPSEEERTPATAADSAGLWRPLERPLAALEAALSSANTDRSEAHA